MTAPGLLDALRPYGRLGVAAFLAGFLSYEAFSGPGAAARPPPAHASTASAPASDAWNLPKRI